MPKKNKQTLSVTLATYADDDPFLEGCLSSVAGLADELIIVLGGESALTEKLAKKYGASLTKTTNPPIFHINKDKANRLATRDWVLQIDTDERVTKELKTDINNLLLGKSFGSNTWISPLKSFYKKSKLLTEPASAYYLPRKNYFLDRYLKHCGQYPDPVIRLFRREKAVLPAKNVHEQMHVDGSVGWIRGELDHVTNQDFSRYLSRENVYSTHRAKELYVEKVPVTVSNTINYLFLKPLFTFYLLFFRYRGFMDGFPGFVFSLYSGFHHAFSYMKLWELYRQNEK